MSHNTDIPQTNGLSGDANGPWLATIRRLYFYLIALISLVASLVGLNGLLAVLARVWLTTESPYTVTTGNFVRDAIASNGGLLLVAAPIFVIHWAYIQGRLNNPDEIQATLRKFFLYGASVAALIYLFTRAYDLLRQITQAALGAGLDTLAIWPDGWLALLLMGGAAYGLRSYLHGILAADGDYGREVGWTGLMRRLFQGGLGIATLIMTLLGAGGLLETIWRLVLPVSQLSAGPDWWRSGIGDGLALALVGALAWWVNWRRWLAITVANPAEAQTGMRRTFLYVGVVVSALTTLIPAALLLRQLILLALGGGGGPMAELLQELTTPLGYVPVGLVAWRWHWRYLAAEAAGYGDSAQSATIRRLYYYLVAATGLGIFWFGLIEVVQVALDALAGAGGAASGSAPFWADPLANGLSLLLVGGPVWVLHWRAVQTVAGQTTPAGRQERAALIRRAYLYGVALAGALVILFSLASVVYRLLLGILGDPSADLLSVETAHDLARSLISATLWAVHLFALRQDGRFADEAEIQKEEMGDRRLVLQKRIQALEDELSQVRKELAQLE